MGSERPLVAWEAALAQVVEQASPLPAEDVRIEEGLGRALAAEVLAKRTVPPWDNSAMDGFALRSAEVDAVPVTLPISHVVFAGAKEVSPLPPGHAAKIMTGAPIPAGADCVLPKERAKELGDKVELHERPSPGQFIRPKGEDAVLGAPLIAQGALLGVPEAQLLWAQGISSVRAPRRPKVAILASGDELSAIDAPFSGGVVDTNSPALALRVRACGGTPTVLGIAKDDRAALRALFERARDHDLVLSSAGASVGDRDFVLEVLTELGVTLHFTRLAIKPGKPLVFGSRGSTLFFALPGNPASALVTFELFVRPALRRLLGLPAHQGSEVTAKLATPLRKQAGLTHFVRVRTERRGDELWAIPLETQSSGAVRSTQQASHLLVFPADATVLLEGQAARLMPVGWYGP